MNNSPFEFTRSRTFDTDRWLYHYTSCETALSYILCQSGRLRFNLLKHLNDPRESKIRVGINGGSGEHSFSDKEIGEMFGKVTDYLSESIKVLCFSKDDHRVATPPFSTPEPFLRGYCKPRMWASYGDNNQGVCLVFDKLSLKKQIVDQFKCPKYHGPVAYQEVSKSHQGWLWKTGFSLSAPPLGLSDLEHSFEGAISSSISKYYQYYFFTKHEDWHGEQEYRYVLYSSADGPEYLDFGDSLIGLTVGVDCTDANIVDLVNVANKRNIPVFQPSWSLDSWGQKGLNAICGDHQ